MTITKYYKIFMKPITIVDTLFDTDQREGQIYIFSALFIYLFIYSEPHEDCS